MNEQIDQPTYESFWEADSRSASQ